MAATKTTAAQRAAKEEAERREQALRDVQALERLAAAAAARESPIGLVKFMMPDPTRADDFLATRYVVKPHHQLISDAINAVFKGEITNLALSVPPQHGKTELAAKGALAWHIGKFPWKHLMFGTYNDDYAREIGEGVRGIVLSEQFRLAFPGVSLQKGSKAKDHMVTTDGARINFLGRGGSGSGRPADGLIVDDPIKDAKEAASMTIRNDVWNWFTQVLNARCHLLTWQIVIQTRWHDDDLIGRLTDPSNPHYDEEVAKRWTVINLPAIIDNEEISQSLGLPMGSALWEERFPLEHLERARRMNPVGFSAMYMGKPTPPDGVIFTQDILHGYKPEELPPMEEMVFWQSGDLAVSDDPTADKTCVGKWGVDSTGTAWLLPNLLWGRWRSDVLVDKIITQSYGDGNKDRAMTFFGEKGPIDRGVGPFLRKRIAERVKERTGHFFHVHVFPTTTDKVQRSMAIRGFMAIGKIRLPTFAPWWPAFRDVLLKFSGADQEDDPVDMLSLFGIAMDEVIGGHKRSSGDKVLEPKIGTLAWVKWQSNMRRREEAARANVAGM